MKRGDVVTDVVPGEFGKLRPALVVQSDIYNEHPSVTILQITSGSPDFPQFRISVHPTERNGLRAPSHMSIDKIFSVKRERIGSVIDQVEDDKLAAVNRAMLVFMGLA
ncbi:type II toxin-antitoxin system PemK/MazF family toxin [Paraburkholderia phymatum]|uniref:type II toxin-antitoxin system PemK/MazF family toxin n=1 Tax=Paraburkholderia phymatum TaxID=148447 RepID=UPI003172093A